MGEVKPSHYIIGILVFTLFIVGGVSMISILRQTDDTFASEERFEQFNSTFNVYNDVESKVGQLEDSVTNQEVDLGVFGVLNALINSAWQTLKLSISSFSFMNAVFLGTHTVFGVPAWVGGLLILAVSVMFVFAIFSAIFQREL